MMEGVNKMIAYAMSLDLRIAKYWIGRVNCWEKILVDTRYSMHPTVAKISN